MMRQLIFILTISVIFIGGCLSESGSYEAQYNFSGVDKIAIVAVEGEIQNDDAKVQIADLFITELLNKGYAPIPLTQVEAKIKSLTDSGEIDEPSKGAYVETGKILKVPAVLVINVPYLGEETAITAQLIDTNDGIVLWMNRDYGDTGLKNEKPSQKVKGRNQEDYLMDPLLMMREPSVTPKIEKPVKPGDRPLNQQELKNLNNVVSRICSTLPSARINASVKKEAPAATLAAEPETAPVEKVKVKTKTTKPRTTSDW